MDGEFSPRALAEQALAITRQLLAGEPPGRERVVELHEHAVSLLDTSTPIRAELDGDEVITLVRDAGDYQIRSTIERYPEEPVYEAAVDAMEATLLELARVGVVMSGDQIGRAAESVLRGLPESE